MAEHSGQIRRQRLDLPRHPIDCSPSRSSLATQPDEHDQRRPDPDQPEHHQHDRDRFHDATCWQR
jgi:hypothetical protein